METPEHAAQHIKKFLDKNRWMTFEEMHRVGLNLDAVTCYAAIRLLHERGVIESRFRHHIHSVPKEYRIRRVTESKQ